MSLRDLFQDNPRPRWRRSNTLATPVRTEDKLGDHMVALLKDFRQQYKAKLPTEGRGLNLKADLATYEKEKRLLVKLASTGHVSRVLERFGRVLDAYIQVFDKDRAEAFTAEWNTRLQEEREDRVVYFRDLMRDDKRLTSQLGGEQQQMELLALLKHDFQRHEKHLLPCERDIMSELYELVVEQTGIVLGESLPIWFVAPGELLHRGNEHFFHGVRVSVVEDVENRPQKYREESCLRQADIWDKLHHPNIVRLLGACHVGKRPIFVHEIAAPLAKQRTYAHLWEPLLGWALALEYLHEHGLGYSTFPDTKLLVRHYLPSKGVLCGLGLVHLQHQEAVTPVNTEAIDEHAQNPRYTAADDVHGFGIAVMNKRILFGGNMTELPKSIPFGLNENEWTLIQRMCAAAPENRVNMEYVVRRLQTFIETRLQELVDGDIWMSYLPRVIKVTLQGGRGTTVENIMVPGCERKVSGVVADLQELSAEQPADRSRTDALLCNRITQVYAKLRTLKNGDISDPALSIFFDVLHRFHRCLKLRGSVDRGESDEKRLSPSTSELALYCAGRTEAATTWRLNHELDHLLTLLGPHSADSAGVPSPKPLQWKQEFETARTQQLDSFRALLQQQSHTELSTEEAMLIQFELESGRNAYPDAMVRKMEATRADLVRQSPSMGLPDWFIAPYQVILRNYVAQGSFAKVYRGEWLDANVVVKVVMETRGTDNEKETAMKTFLEEANNWAMLEHDNVVRLYGACHVGERFFVCEGAHEGTLPEYLRKLKPKPSFSDKIGYLFQAALGLRYLHDRGIIHDDLKGDNIMVGAGRRVKLCDFGLSIRMAPGSRSKIASLGAFRWKAPERLAGTSEPTTASDVYAFGMCILEIMADAFPWGTTLEAVVKFHVKRGHLPPRPSSKELVNDLQWNLIERMCCFESSERITMSAVVDTLFSIRYAN